MKVKASKLFRAYRGKVLGLGKNDFTSLKAGKTIEIKKEIFDKYPHVYEVVEKQPEVKKNGN